MIVISMVPCLEALTKAQDHHQVSQDADTQRAVDRFFEATVAEADYQGLQVCTLHVRTSRLEVFLSPC